MAENAADVAYVFAGKRNSENVNCADRLYARVRNISTCAGRCCAQTVWRCAEELQGRRAE